MFEISKLIYDVKELIVSKKTTAYINNGILVFNEKKYQVNPMIYKIDSLGNVWLKDDKWENFHIDTANDKKNKLDFNISVSSDINDVVIISKSGDRFCYSIKEHSIIMQFDEIFKYKSYVTKENNVIFNCESHLQAFSLPQAAPKWQFDLAELGTFKQGGAHISYEIKHFIGVYKNCLIVQLYNARFLFIDIHTGRLIKDLSLHEVAPLPEGVHYEDFPAHLVNDTLVFLTNQCLLHIDLVSYSIQIIKKYFAEEREQQYRFFANTYYNGQLYFVADYGWQYVTPSRVGLMDANTGVILWQQQLQDTGGLPEAPQVTDTKLYIRTANNTLYIFEKEQDV